MMLFNIKSQSLSVWAVIVSLIAAISLIGCAGAPPAPEAAPPQCVGNTPVREFLVGPQRPDSTYAAFGYVIFPVRPETSDEPRIFAFCKSYLKKLESSDNYPVECDSQLMPTFWPLAGAPADEASVNDCAWLIGNYNYALGNGMAAAIGRLDSPGPILVAWTEPFSSTTDDDNALLLDLSEFSADDMSEALMLWRDRISKISRGNTSFWLGVDNARITFRNFLNKYGDRIIEGIKTTKDTLFPA